MSKSDTPHVEGDEDQARRQRLIAAVMDVLPGQKPHPYDDRYRVYEGGLHGQDGAPLSSLQDVFTARLALAMRRWRKLLDDSLGREGQSLVRWQVMCELSLKSPVQTLTSLAARVGILSGALVGLLDQLEQEGLIRRTVDARDRRSKLIILTPEGEELAAFMHDFTAELRQEFLEEISVGELRLMLDAVERMNSALDRMHRRR